MSLELDDAGCEEIWALAASVDTWAALDRLIADFEPPSVMKRFASFCRWASTKGELARYAAFARAGIQYGLRAAARIERESPEAASELRGTAKALAYNLGANTWPGWGDPIALNATDLAVGLDAAKLNLRLAQELKRGAGPLGNAEWLLGAQHLAAGEWDLAQAAFLRAEIAFQGVPQSEMRMMADGYAALVEVLQNLPEARVRLSSILAILRAAGTEDGTFFAEQLETALRVFSSRKP